MRPSRESGISPSIIGCVPSRTSSTTVTSTTVPRTTVDDPTSTSRSSRHSIDAGEVYVVLPEHPWWTAHPRWIDGKPLADGFVYASNTNDDWLTSEQLVAMLP